MPHGKGQLEQEICGSRGQECQCIRQLCHCCQHPRGHQTTHCWGVASSAIATIANTWSHSGHWAHVARISVSSPVLAPVKNRFPGGHVESGWWAPRMRHYILVLCPLLPAAPPPTTAWSRSLIMPPLEYACTFITMPLYTYQIHIYIGYLLYSTSLSMPLQ